MLQEVLKNGAFISLSDTMLLASCKETTKLLPTPTR